MAAAVEQDEFFLTLAVLVECRRIIVDSEIMKEDDNSWPEPNRVGRQELEIVMGNQHISFTTSKIGSLVDVQSSKDPDGLRIFYYLAQGAFFWVCLVLLKTQGRPCVDLLCLSSGLEAYRDELWPAKEYRNHNGGPIKVSNLDSTTPLKTFVITLHQPRLHCERVGRHGKKMWPPIQNGTQPKWVSTSKGMLGDGPSGIMVIEATSLLKIMAAVWHESNKDHTTLKIIRVLPLASASSQAKVNSAIWECAIADFGVAFWLGT